MSQNPPAFPRTGEGFGNPHYDEPGMSLRDWFAGQALASMNDVIRWPQPDHGEVAKRLYAIADAMLDERSRSNPSSEES